MILILNMILIDVKEWCDRNRPTGGDAYLQTRIRWSPETSYVCSYFNSCFGIVIDYKLTCSSQNLAPKI